MMKSSDRFVKSSLFKEHSPEMLKKTKIHLMEHIVDGIRQFGATPAYNTERLVHALNTVMLPR